MKKNNLDKTNLEITSDEQNKIDEMSFKKKLLKPAFSLFGCHVGGIVMGFIFCFGLTALFDSTWGLIASSILVLLIYSIPVYGNMWALGYKDTNREHFDRIDKDIFKGFKIGAIASIPSFILAILFILSKFNLFYNFIFLYKLLNSELVPIINLIKNRPYLPEYSVFEVILIALLTLIPVGISGLCYIMGHNNFSPIYRLVYKKKENNTKTDPRKK